MAAAWRQEARIKWSSFGGIERVACERHTLCNEPSQAPLPERQRHTGVGGALFCDRAAQLPFKLSFTPWTLQGPKSTAKVACVHTQKKQQPAGTSDRFGL